MIVSWSRESAATWFGWIEVIRSSSISGLSLLHFRVSLLLLRLNWNRKFWSHPSCIWSYVSFLRRDPVSVGSEEKNVAYHFWPRCGRFMITIDFLCFFCCCCLAVHKPNWCLEQEDVRDRNVWYLTPDARWWVFGEVYDMRLNGCLVSYLYQNQLFFFFICIFSFVCLTR